MSEIVIDVRRGDGEVTRLEGVAGIAIMMQTDIVPTLDPDNVGALKAALREMPILSIRTDNHSQLAVMLGAFIAFCRTQNPEIISIGGILSNIIDAGNPVLHRTLPKEKPE